MRIKNWTEEQRRLLRAPILITGCARSGTSLVAGVIHYCGAWIGKVTGKTRYNQKGQFENSFIRDRIVKPYITNQGYDPLGQRPLPKIDKLRIDPYLRNKVETTIYTQGYRGETQWAYKGAKLCLIWPNWILAFPDAKWIIVRRKDEEIANSCLRTGFMRKYSDAMGWLRWVDHHKARFAELKQQTDSIREVWPEKMFKGNWAEIKSVVAWLGLDWNREMVHGFLEPRLWNKGKGNDGGGK